MSLIWLCVLFAGIRKMVENGQDDMFISLLMLFVMFAASSHLGTKEVLRQPAEKLKQVQSRVEGFRRARRTLGVAPSLSLLIMGEPLGIGDAIAQGV